MTQQPDPIAAIFKGIDNRFDQTDGALAALAMLGASRAFAIDHLPGPVDPAFDVIRRYEKRVAEMQLRLLDRAFEGMDIEAPDSYREGFVHIISELRKALGG